MATCEQCGKKGLFVKVNRDGICKKCQLENEEFARKKHQQQVERSMNEANILYDKIVEADEKLYPICVERISNDYFTADLGTPLLYRGKERYTYLEYCNKLLDLLDQCYDKPYVEFAILDDDRFRIFPNETYLDFINRKILETKAKKEKCQSIVEKTESFENTLKNLNCVDIEIDATAEPKRYYVKDFPLFESTNIVKRTPRKTFSTFYVVDVETTGLKVGEAEIIQLSAIRFEDFEPAEAFSTYVKPRKGIKPGAYNVNFISESMVENAPYIEQVIPAFNEFINDKHPVVGHNLKFDYKFLCAAGAMPLANGRRFYDTLELSRKAFDSDEYNLQYLTNLGLEIFTDSFHNSLSDCLATGYLLRRIYNIIT